MANPRTKGKFASATVQALDDGQGRTATCDEGGRAVWHAHFAKTEAAVDTGFETLLKQVRLSHGRLRGTCVLDPGVVPTRADIESSFRKARNNRSSGPDGLPDELFFLFPRGFGRAFGPAFFKAVLRFDMPLQWIGCLLHELFKGNGAITAMPN